MSIKENFNAAFNVWKNDWFTVKLIKVCFIVWVVLWCVFFLKENKDGEYRDFFALFHKTLEEKRAYLLEDDLYVFLGFCRENLPEGARYKLAGLPEFSIREVRSIYYLAPLRAAEQGYDYILVFGDEAYGEEGFVKYSGYAKDKFILRRAGWR